MYASFSKKTEYYSQNLYYFKFFTFISWFEFHFNQKEGSKSEIGEGPREDDVGTSRSEINHREIILSNDFFLLTWKQERDWEKGDPLDITAFFWEKKLQAVVAIFLQ